MTQHLAEYALGSVFLAWTGLTLLQAVDQTFDTNATRRLPRVVAFLVPNWNFFAPHPGEWDYHLLYRRVDATDEAPSWNELPRVNRTRSRLKWLWNPNMHVMKALFDITQELTSVLSEQEESPDDANERPPDDGKLRAVEDSSVQLSPQYLYLLNYVVSNADLDGAAKVQFAILAHKPQVDDTEPMFVSGVHEV
ncbi:hypothetical protein [Halorubellus litoreus]|uniref:Uncharacterized protein n=1 Tax=Halorubellus litoreus TaxID=755308 RepID=A0ABD5VAI1_9EURY